MLVSLRNQWPHVKGNAFYEAQYRKGHTFWRGYYGEMLFLYLQLRRRV